MDTGTVRQVDSSQEQCPCSSPTAESSPRRTTTSPTSTATTASITAIGKDLPAASLPGRPTIDAIGQVRHPRRHRRPHPPEHAVRRHDLRRRFRVRHHRGRIRRHDQHRRLRDPVPRPDDAACAGRLAEARRRQGGDRLRLPHDRHRARGRRARRDGPPGPRRGDHQLQAVHGLPRRLHGGRRDDLPGAAPDRGERRPRVHARRERRRHRRAREGSAAQGRDGAEVSRADAPADGRRGSDRPRDRARRDGAAFRSTSSICRRRMRSRR